MLLIYDPGLEKEILFMQPVWGNVYLHIMKNMIPDKLKIELEKIRKSGYSIDNEEIEEGLRHFLCLKQL